MCYNRRLIRRLRGKDVARMPRALRCWDPGGVYHVTVRGNDRQAIFLDAGDYQQHLLQLGKARQEAPTTVLAYALMPNHVHLLLEASRTATISKMMQLLNTRYTRYFNDRYGRVGHLYQGRFFSNTVGEEAYFLEVTRYIHLNPVRARLVGHAADYVWSSYRTYGGYAPDPLHLINPASVLELFGGDAREQTARYRSFVEDLQEEELEARIERLRAHRLIPSRCWLQTAD